MEREFKWNIKQPEDFDILADSDFVKPLVTEETRLEMEAAYYDTADGSCIRDYINVVDLAKAHVIAMDRMLENKSDEHIEIFNLGTGNGVSVLELINTFEQTTGVKVPHKIVGRREGDIEKVWANPEHANKVLGWTAKETLADTLQSAWNWQKRLRERGIQ